MIDRIGLELVLARGKGNGHRRTNPSSSSESVVKMGEMIKCSWKDCKMQLESEGLLNAHIQEHRLMYSCKSCDENFSNESDLSNHFDSIHAKSLWTCATCGDKFTSDGDLSEHTLSKNKDE